ncbi:4950_t:CDS:1 [Funneliformis geosporum]|nr:4950_t:CDS:1 [Funneliformis geosporum]
MIDALNLQDPITAEKFIHIDDEIPIGLLSNKEIIDAVISNSEKNDIKEKEEEKLAEINIITNKETLNSLQSVIQYFKNPPNNVLINYTELKVLSTLKSKINRYIQDNTKQSILDSFMQH